MRIALFGGSFNPIHNGHLKIASELIEKKIANKVWFIPCGNHAFGKELASGKDRINMLNLAIKNNSKLKVIDIEVKSNKKSFTANTIRLLRKKFPYEFYFVIGADNLKEFDKWYNIQYLQNSVEFILIKRPEYSIPKKIKLKILRTVSLKLSESSTEIRKLIKDKKSILKFVPKAVAEYIHMGGLYQ